MSALAEVRPVTRVAAVRLLHYYPRALRGDGGPTRAVHAWAAGAAAAGADVRVACEPGDGHLDVDVHVVAHRGGGRRKLPGSELAAALADSDVAVLHSGWVAHNLRAAALADRAGVPYVLTPHGAYHPLVVARGRLVKRAWWLAAERRLVRGAHAVHVFFDDDRDDLAALGYDGATIVAPNPVEVPAGRRWDGGSGGYVLWLGRYDVVGKGLDRLLQAVARLPAHERPELRLHGPDWRGGRADAKRLRDDLGLEASVSIGGPVYGEEKWWLLERAAGFVYPSRWEAFGLAPAEAVALGVPTLMSPVPLGRFLAARGAALVADDLAEGLRALPNASGLRGAEVAARELSRDRVARSFLDQVAALR